MPKIELVRGIESIEGWVEVARLLKQKMKKWGHQLTRDIETLTEKGQKNLGVIEKEVGRPMKEKVHKITELEDKPNTGLYL